MPELIPYLVFSPFGVPLALTPIQILSIDTGTDSLTAPGLLVAEEARKWIVRAHRRA
ncbi:MAG TPA: hypothetical protein VNE82_05455 [Candidatus Binataceae bacterium]|nr:hypothetical protein [Candidatus Binataceae bacterium]